MSQSAARVDRAQVGGEMLEPSLGLLARRRLPRIADRRARVAVHSITVAVRRAYVADSSICDADRSDNVADRSDNVADRSDNVADSRTRAAVSFEALLRGDVKVRFDESRAAAEALIPICDEIIAVHAATPESQRTQDEVNRFNLALLTFHSAIQRELGRAPLFLVTVKGVYDTWRLIEQADAVNDGYADRLPPDRRHGP